MDSAEHVWIGQQIKLEFKDGEHPAEDLHLQITEPGTARQTITYGQGIALGGDFYGVVGAPISTAADPQKAFRAAWATLPGGNKVERSEILRILQIEIDLVAKAIEEGKEPSTVYATLGNILSVEWAAATAFRYLNLASENWDHFGAHAVTAYTAGHAVACHEAALAAAPGIPDAEKRVRLERAYAMNAFADHFLTDLFSSGHLRVPRKEMYDRPDGLKSTLGMLVHAMHNEDGWVGLNVDNVQKDAWVAFGDGYLRDKISERNAKLVVQAAQESANEVWQSYEDPTKAVGNKALELIPDFKALADRDDIRNFPALFTLNAKAQVERRINMSGRTNRAWTDQWKTWPTYLALPKPKDPGYTHVACFDRLTVKSVGWLATSPSGINLPNVGLVQDQRAAHGMKWYLHGDDLYLQKDTSGPTGDLYLCGTGGSPAFWGLWGMAKPVRVNDDHTVSLADNPAQMLCVPPGTDPYGPVFWSNGTSDAGFILIDFPLPQPD